jgi:hypothetical protein
VETLGRDEGDFQLVEDSPGVVVQRDPLHLRMSALALL